MAKRMISRLSVLVVLMVFMAACSKKSEYTNVIPADASAVASIHLKSLADKSGLKDKENEAAKQKMIEALKSGTTAATFQQLEKVLNNPKESGIDVDVPVYAFTATSFPYTALVAKVSDQDKLHTSLDIMVKEQICQPIEAADGYSYTRMGQRDIFAFNETTVMLVQTGSTSQIENAQKMISELMKQTAEKSIANNAGFQKMQKQKGDINFFASLAALPKEYTRQLNLGLTGIKIDPKDIMALGSLSFEKGKIALLFQPQRLARPVLPLRRPVTVLLFGIQHGHLHHHPRLRGVWRVGHRRAQRRIPIRLHLAGQQDRHGAGHLSAGPGTGSGRLCLQRRTERNRTFDHASRFQHHSRHPLGGNSRRPVLLQTEQTHLQPHRGGHPPPCSEEKGAEIYRKII